MLKRILILLVVSSLMISCGPKVTKSNADILKRTEMRVSEINSNKNLKETKTEGALTDAEGFKDIGVFNYFVLFDAKTNELHRIINEEITDKTIKETYYFQNNGLFYISIETANKAVKKMHVSNGKVLESENVTPEEQTVFLDKAKRFQRLLKKHIKTKRHSQKRNISF